MISRKIRLVLPPVVRRFICWALRRVAPSGTSEVASPDDWRVPPFKIAPQDLLSHLPVSVLRLPLVAVRSAKVGVTASAFRARAASGVAKTGVERETKGEPSLLLHPFTFVSKVFRAAL